MVFPPLKVTVCFYFPFNWSVSTIPYNQIHRLPSACYVTRHKVILWRTYKMQTIKTICDCDNNYYSLLGVKETCRVLQDFITGKLHNLLIPILILSTRDVSCHNFVIPYSKTIGEMNQQTDEMCQYNLELILGRCKHTSSVKE